MAVMLGACTFPKGHYMVPSTSCTTTTLRPTAATHTHTHAHGSHLPPANWTCKHRLPTRAMGEGGGGGAVVVSLCARLWLCSGVSCVFLTAQPFSILDSSYAFLVMLVSASSAATGFCCVVLPLSGFLIPPPPPLPPSFTSAHADFVPRPSFPIPRFLPCVLCLCLHPLRPNRL